MIKPSFEILNQKGTPMFYSDVYANIPTAGIVGRMFISTDTYAFYRDTGSGWDLIGGPGTGTITGSGATGQVSFFNGASTIGGSNNLFWDSANNRLGIGTATPGVPLDIHTTGTAITLNGTATNNSFLTFQNAGTGKWRIGNNYSTGSNYFSIYNVLTSSEVLSIANSGISTFSKQVTVNDFIVTTQEHVTQKDSLAGGNVWYGMKNGSAVNRWNIGASTAETGSGNTGFDFNLWRYDDAGVNLGYAMQIIRSTGNVTFANNITAASLIKSGGTSSQFLKADGSIDSNTYLTTSSAASTYLPLAGGTLTGALTISTALQNSFTLDSSHASLNQMYFNMSGSNYGKVYLYKTGSIYDMVVGTYTATGRVRFETGNNTTALTLNADQTATFVGQINGTSATFSGDLTIDTNTLYVDSTNNRVGIGTITPTAGKFQINESATQTVVHFQNNDTTTTLANSFITNFRNSNDGNGRYSLSSWQVQNGLGNDQIGFIGVQSVTGAGNYTPNLIFGLKTGASTYSTYFTIASNGVATFSGNVEIQNTYPRIKLIDTNNNSDYSIINADGDLSFYDDTNSAARLYITSGGNVLINGTTDNGYKLDVTGGFRGSSVYASSGYVNETQTISTQASVYSFNKDQGAAGGSSSTTFNITGLPNVDGAFAFVYVRVSNTAAGINCTGIIQVNGNTIFSGTTQNATKTASFSIYRQNGTWVTTYYVFA